MQYLLLLLFPALALGAATADRGYGHPPPAPKLYCRPTNTSVYAEVCVPGIDTATEPVGLNIKRVEDDQFCYTKTSTSCEEVTRTIDREVCTYEYEQRRVKAGATTTQVTYEDKSETMKVTSCRPTPQYGYHQDPYADKGEYQKCREEYQTQQYRVPKVDVPLEIAVDIAFPEPRQACQTVSIEVTETVCQDNSEEVCIGLAKLEDDKQYVDQVREKKMQFAPISYPVLTALELIIGHCPILMNVFLLFRRPPSSASPTATS